MKGKWMKIEDMPIRHYIEGCDEPKTVEEIIEHLNNRAKRIREEREKKLGNLKHKEER